MQVCIHIYICIVCMHEMHKGRNMTRDQSKTYKQKLWLVHAGVGGPG